MDKKLSFFLFFLFIILIINTIILFKPKITRDIIKNQETEEPDKVINNLYEAIQVAEEKGEYKCCIEPACTMCYLGHWKFEKGTCYCDLAISEGRNEDVCPECKSGLEQGLCNSVEQEECELNEETFGGLN
jgi:hypothetical protein